MMKKPWMAAALAMVAAGAAQAAGVELPGPAFPNYRNAVQVRQACDAGLWDAQNKLKTLEKLPASPTWLASYDAFNAAVEDSFGPVAFVSNVHPDEAVRTASEACEQRWQGFFTWPDEAYGTAVLDGLRALLLLSGMTRLLRAGLLLFPLR